MHPAVVVVGSYNQDYAWRSDCLPQPGETRRALGFATGPGGKGYNQAMACHRQGVPTCLIAALGDDTLAGLARHHAEHEGLACRWQIVTGAATGSACVLIDADGQNRILVHLAANERLDAAFVRAARADFASARVVLAQLETGIAPVRAALCLARDHGALALLNPAPVHAELDHMLLASCDLVTPNETEFVALLSRLDGTCLDPGVLADGTDAELHALARRLPVPTVVITLGARGCFVSHAGSARLRGADAVAYRVPAFPARSVDSSGAGDAFSGALAAELARAAGGTFAMAVAWASAAAALSTERVGAASAMPTRDEVAARRHATSVHP
ncbi:MAG: ribokinase [Xanthomonadaceae bacterium]|nr:ribokinase [Xanthomonadaceae bacterium]